MKTGIQYHRGWTMSEHEVQAIDVGPVRVDTGNDWMDLGFGVIFLVLLAVIGVIVKKSFSGPAPGRQERD